MWTSKRMFCRLHSRQPARYKITFLQMLPAGRDNLV